MREPFSRTCLWSWGAGWLFGGSSRYLKARMSALDTGTKHVIWGVHRGVITHTNGGAKRENLKKTEGAEGVPKRMQRL